MNGINNKTKLKYFNSLLTVAKELLKDEYNDVDFHYDRYGYHRDITPGYQKLEKIINSIEKRKVL